MSCDVSPWLGILFQASSITLDELRQAQVPQVNSTFSGVLVMNHFLKSLKTFTQDESGATAIEYGLIAGILSIGIVTVLGTIKTDLVGVFTKIGTALTGV